MSGLEDTDNTSSHQVDGRGNERHYTVTLYDFGSTVHGTVEVGLSLNLLSSLSGLLLRNHSGRKIRVNGHLLTGHSIQLKTGCHFGYTLRTLGNNNKLHQYDNQVDNQTYHHVTLYNEVTEGLDDCSGGSAVG